MRVQLRRRISVNWARAVVLKSRRNPFTGCFGWIVAAHAGLGVSFELVQSNLHALTMCLSYFLVTTNERSQRHTLWRGESRIPTCTMLHRSDCFAAFIDALPCGLVADHLLAR